MFFRLIIASNRLRLSLIIYIIDINRLLIFHWVVMHLYRVAQKSKPLSSNSAGAAAATEEGGARQAATAEDHCHPICCQAKCTIM